MVGRYFVYKIITCSYNPHTKPEKRIRYHPYSAHKEMESQQRVFANVTQLEIAGRTQFRSMSSWCEL